MNGLLDGVRVLDLSRVLAGPFGAQVMAEMGADVVKVEFGAGDWSRGTSPIVGGRSLYFSSVNTDKRGVALDPSTEEGRAQLERLLARADVVVENFRPSAARDLGLLPDQLLGRHPQVVLVTVSGFARGSSRSGEPAYDVSIQAEAGLMSVTGELGGGPVRAGVPISDLVAGMWVALGAVSGLVRRATTGRGTHIEVPLLDATLPLLSYMAPAALHHGVDPPKVGSGHHVITPYGAFEAKDGWVVIAVLADKFWPKLCDALGLDALAGRPELTRNENRLEVRAEVESAVAEAVSRCTTAEALAKLNAAEVPCAPVLGLLDALASPYVRERGIVCTVDAPEGPYGIVQGPLHDGRPRRPAPRLGEHTDEVL
ncbi:MAG TPA: CoA transferase, partial [Acidimicrobiia bacterium]|nr:CoA transferase [Acidimicrobiia bacterium]